MPAIPMIGRSAAHLALLEKLQKVAPTDAEVLLTGPSGAGKEVYAHYLHDHSRRRGAAFVPVNCGGLPIELLENELFGHVGGAFTGARDRADGLVAQAEGGTLFFDEVDALAPLNQAKLLRFFQQKEYRRLGDTRLRHANVRLLAATNADLEALVRAGSFRADLFFRLRVVPLGVPPLSDRREDVAPLAAAYAEHYAREYGVACIELTEGALRALEGYAWPGNVRELENCVRYLTCLQSGRPVQERDLLLLEQSPRADCAGPPTLGQAKRSLVERFERNWLEDALQKSGGNIAQAARDSGKARRAFFELMRKRGVKSPASV